VKPLPINLSRRRLAAAFAVGWLDARAAATPASTNFRDLDWRDSARGRTVPVRLYAPSGESSAHLPVPLVLYSHGFGGDRSDAAWLGSTLAANGIACAHVQHVGSDRLAWMMGPVDWALREWRGDFTRERLARTQDLRFALDRLLAGELGAVLDRRRVAAVGHSLGAQTVALLGGARLAGGDRLRDERISAVAIIGMPSFRGEDTAKVLSALEVPSLHVTTEEDRTVLPGYAATANDRVSWFRSTGGTAKVIAVFGHGAHAIFNDVDRTDPIGAASGELVQSFLESCWQPTMRSRRLAGWYGRNTSLVTRFETLGMLD
jgi:predicted dienelactone hydrolase